MSEYVQIIVENPPAIVEEIINDGDTVTIAVDTPAQVVDVIIQNVITQLISNDTIFGEVLTGPINNSNATFTTAYNFIAGKIAVYVNGLLQKNVTHFQSVGNDMIIFMDSPQTGDILEADYIIL